jgi:membrane protease YdiL (CAAX protease family)
MERAARPVRLNWRSLHAVVFLFFFLATMHFRIAPSWPWHLCIPLIAYAAVCRTIAPLRRTWMWTVFGRCDRGSLLATAAVVAISIAALAVYQWKAMPDVRATAAELPARVLGSMALAGAWFAAVNATLEELVFRGILYDAAESLWGSPAAMATTAAFFGGFHLFGYPPGPLGAVLAGMYGLLLGWLRHRTGGLALPIAAHVFADATIFVIFAHAGAL